MIDSKYGIWPPYEAFYIHSMLFNAQSAVSSIHCISNILERLASDETRAPISKVEEDDILNNLQNIIVQGAALSRYFWPVRKGHESRARHLKMAFDIEEDNPLKVRDLRNALEHFDEKLDLYLENGIVGNIFPQYVGSCPMDEDVPRHIFRAYYLDIGRFEILGKTYEIQPIADEIYRIYDYLITFSKNGDRMKLKES